MGLRPAQKAPQSDCINTSQGAPFLTLASLSTSLSTFPPPYFQPRESQRQPSERVRNRRVGEGQNSKEGDPLRSPRLRRARTGGEEGFNFESSKVLTVTIWLVLLFTIRRMSLWLKMSGLFVTWECLESVSDLPRPSSRDREEMRPHTGQFLSPTCLEGMERSWVWFRTPSFLPLAECRGFVWAREERQGKGKCLFI